MAKTKAKVKVNAVPAGFHNVTPYLIVKGAAKAIDFYKNVFGAREVMRMPGPDGRIGHAELQMGDSRVMLADEAPQMGARAPEAFGGTPVSLMLYVEDVDSVVEKAVAAGSKILQPVKDQFYGDRNGTLTDPFGHKWTVGTHKEDVSEQEMAKRASAMAAAAFSRVSLQELRNWS